MTTFGRYGMWPIRFGGGPRPIEAVHNALLDAYAPALAVDDSQIAFVEAYAEASVIAAGWAGTNRLANQGQPLKMCENLPVWEQATRLRPQASDLPIMRRQALAGKLRGASGNTLTDIRDTLAALAPNNFMQVLTTQPSNEITYWPVENPGPPGREWSSNRLKLYVQLNMNGLTLDAFSALVSAVSRQLDAMLPSDETYGIFVADMGSPVTTQGFHIGVSRLGVNGL